MAPLFSDVDNNVNKEHEHGNTTNENRFDNEKQGKVNENYQ